MDTLFVACAAWNVGMLIVLSPCGVRTWEVLFLYYGMGLFVLKMHALGHARDGIRWWTRQHMGGHHVRHYPLRRFTAPAPYRVDVSPHRDGNLWLYVVPSAAVCLILGRAPLHTTALLAYMALTFARENYVHMAVHTEGHVLERYAWFRAVRETHRKHHTDPTVNLGFLDPTHDLILGTYR